MNSEADISDRARRAGVPDHLIDGLTNYLLYGLRPGHFLEAVLSNDLIEALKRGDEQSIAGLPALGRFLYHDMPANAWGSPDAVIAWMIHRGAAHESSRTAAV